MVVGWMDSPAFDAHVNPSPHPERPARLFAVREALAGSGVGARLRRREPEPAADEVIARAHDRAYLAALQAMCASGGGALDADTAVVPASWAAAQKAAGAVVGAVDLVLDGTWERAFCSVRPPGHHARPSAAMGFCLVDSIAVGALHARARGLSRVAILDWDVHHGNGTQEIFYERGDVLFCSWHQYPFYPGTGAETDVGRGEGIGTTVNCPIGAGEGDAAYLSAWHARVRPALDRFEPELVLVSAGFDADHRDPLAGLTVSPGGFASLSQAVADWCGEHDLGLVSVLEGGYDLDALAEDVRLHVETLVG